MDLAPLVLAYLAGVVDADGTIYVKRSTYGVRRDTTSTAGYAPTLCVSQVERGAVDLLSDTFGGSVRPAPTRVATRRDRWRWQVGNQRAAQVLLALMPHLRIKSPAAGNAVRVSELNRQRRRFDVPTVADNEPLLTTAEVADATGLSVGSVRAAAQQGRIPFVKHGRRTLIPASFVPIWLERGQTPRRDPRVTEELHSRWLLSKELNETSRRPLLDAPAAARSDEELAAYAAGIIDSDGCITIKRVRAGQGRSGDSFVPYVVVGQAAPEAISELAAAMGGYTRTDGRGLHHWSVHSAAAGAILERILPHLRIKAPQARNALDLLELRSRQRRFAPPPPVIEGEPLVTASEAAEAVGLAVKSVYQAARQGTVPVVRKGRSVFIPASFLPLWRSRGSTPSRSPELTARMERCYTLGRELNRVGPR